MVSAIGAATPGADLPRPAPGGRRRPPPLASQCPCWTIAAFAAMLLGAKFWLIGPYGNATPYWDQWDAEAANLYKPLLEGTLGWADLLVPQNEHHVLMTPCSPSPC